MGKLLRRFLHGLLPSSWVVKIKLSDGPPRKLLPFFRGPTTPSSKSTTVSRNSGSTNSASASVSLGSNNNEIFTEITDRMTTREPNREGIVIQKTVQDAGMDEDSSVAAEVRKRKRKSECFEEKNTSSHSNNSHVHCQSPKSSSKRAKKASAIATELPDCLCEVVGDTSAVVKYVEDPEQELWESMVEMIVGNGVWELPNLECLLYCYLSLNDSPLHQTIKRTFLRVLCDLERTS